MMKSPSVSPAAAAFLQSLLDVLSQHGQSADLDPADPAAAAALAERVRSLDPALLLQCAVSAAVATDGHMDSPYAPRHSVLIGRFEFAREWADRISIFALDAGYPIPVMVDGQVVSSHRFAGACRALAGYLGIPGLSLDVVHP